MKFSVMYIMYVESSCGSGNFCLCIVWPPCMAGLFMGGGVGHVCVCVCMCEGGVHVSVRRVDGIDREIELLLQYQ